MVNCDWWLAVLRDDLLRREILDRFSLASYGEFSSLTLTPSP